MIQTTPQAPADACTTLARCRMKLRPFGIEIKSLTNVGYVLIPLKGRVRTHAVAV